MASPSILQLSAKAIIAILVDNDTLVFPIIFNPTERAVNPPPTPISPFPISPNDKSDNFTIASLRILIATATNINAVDDLTIPLESNLVNDFVKERKVKLSITIIDPMADKDFATSSPLSFDNVLSEADNIPTAMAMETREATFIPLANAARES